MSANTSEPAHTMITLSKKGFTDTAAWLNKFAQLDTSVRRGKFTDDVKNETLEHLRSLFENQRKSFLFALVNASDGLSAAAQIVDTGPTGLLSRKEQKKMEKLNKSKKERKFRSNNFDRSKLPCYKCGKVKLKLFLISCSWINFRLDILPKNARMLMSIPERDPGWLLFLLIQTELLWSSSE